MMSVDHRTWTRSSAVMDHLHDGGRCIFLLGMLTGGGKRIEDPDIREVLSNNPSDNPLVKMTCLMPSLVLAVGWLHRGSAIYASC